MIHIRGRVSATVIARANGCCAGVCGFNLRTWHSFVFVIDDGPPTQEKVLVGDVEFEPFIYFFYISRSFRHNYVILHR